jgi:DNA invertase Pin-like site-specific DNA recombinase
MMNPKIQPAHLEREAIVYVRQSSMGQVRYRLEGQRRQYDLAEQARELGFARVTVIDEDMGRSGTGTQDRPGFGRLLAAVARVESALCWHWKPRGWPATTATGII